MGPIIVTAEYVVSRWSGREYLRLKCTDSRWPLYITAENTEEAKGFCDDFLGKGNWKLIGDEL